MSSPGSLSPAMVVNGGRRAGRFVVRLCLDRNIPTCGADKSYAGPLPEYVLQRIDEKVKRDPRYASRSGFLASAALRELAVAR